MSTDSKIEWTDATFNPWFGCMKVSDGCKHCYAETMSKRNPAVLGEWGPNGIRRIASGDYWKQPLKWNARAEREGKRLKVFCASMADVFEDRPDLHFPRLRLFDLIAKTPNLDWLLLTKRPENIRPAIYEAHSILTRHLQDTLWDGKRLGMHWLNADDPPKNVWLGVSCENQETADERIPLLLETPATVRFLSCEPLLGPIKIADVSDWKNAVRWWGNQVFGHGVIDWVIVGGESGPGARRMEREWAESLREQCAGTGTAFFFKQAGTVLARELGCSDTKGHILEEMPQNLRVREFPANNQTAASDRTAE